MCLAIPGKIIGITGADGNFPSGLVDFQGSRVQVSLALVPETQVGDWVLVHAGFAITQLDEAEARETWDYLSEAGLVEETPMEQPGPRGESPPGD